MDCIRVRDLRSPRDPEQQEQVPNMSLASLTSISSSVFGSIKSHSTMIDFEGFSPRTKICLIGEEINPTVEAAAECFELPVVKSSTGVEYLEDSSVLFVVDDFCEGVFDKLINISWRVVGVPALIHCANENQPLPISKRPILCFTMSGVITCFTGIRDPERAKKLMFFIRSMGGSVRKEPNMETTHMIAATTKGPKYNYAVTFIVPIMSLDWVYHCWEMRAVHGVHATDDRLMAYRQKPFLDVFASFIGFPKDELDEIVKLLKSNGGSHVAPYDPQCTHIVADDISPVTIPASATPDAAVVRADWFWTCIQQVVRVPEADFPVPPECFRRVPTRDSMRRPVTANPLLNKENVVPTSPGACAANKAPPLSPSSPTPKAVRKLRRFSLANVSPLSPGSPTPKTVCKKQRRLSLANVSSWGNGTAATPSSPSTPDTLTPSTPELNADKTLVGPSAPDDDEFQRTLHYGPRSPGPFSGVPFRSDRTAATPGTPSTPITSGTPSSRGTPGAQRRKVSLESVALPPISPRYGAFLELLHTEENYVAILDTILQMRSEALSPGQAGGVLLTHTEAKIIFGALMPIAKIHHSILKDLRVIYNNWTETANVGELFQRHCPDLVRDYAPFVSSFEESKNMLQQASERNPRFHAFLKICRGRPQCGRQELQELMIRPIQRLGSCKLLLREILKHTAEDSHDRKQLELAVESLSNVLSLINEDKRKMDSLCQVFDVHNLVDKCPADLIASHRSLIAKCEGVELSSQGFGKPGNHIAFFVFTDVILVCKKKSKVVTMMKGQPQGSSIPHRILKMVGGKPFKFLQVLPLSTIKKLVDVTDSESVTNAVGVVFRGKTEVRESCSYFRLLAMEGAQDKAQLLERWSCALANHNCVPDAERFVQHETAEEAGIHSASALLAKQINKAAQMAVRTQVVMISALGLGRSQSAATRSNTSPARCAMSSFNSTSKLETLSVGVLGEPLEGDSECERPKPSSLTANIMKRM